MIRIGNNDSQYYIMVYIHVNCFMLCLPSLAATTITLAGPVFVLAPFGAVRFLAETE